MGISFAPITLPSDFGDSQGALVMRDDVLLAIVSRLGPLHSDRGGQWFVEASFIDPQLAAGSVHDQLSDIEAALVSGVGAYRQAAG